MPNSSWTETGTSIDLVPTSTTITNNSPQQESVDYLTNADKIALMAQYAQELATKTALDTTASGLGVPTTNYDNAVAGINATLVAAGAPAGWATTWPDGTTFGPASGIKTALAGDLSGIATARASLQSAISATQASQQAAAARTAAIAEAAADATSKMSAAINAAKVKVVDGLPTLPNADYPLDTTVWNVQDQALYGTDGYDWIPLTLDAQNLTGKITETQITDSAISTPKLAAASVTADKILANTITAGQIAAGAIGAEQIAAKSITATKMVIADTTNTCLNPSGDVNGAVSNDGWNGGGAIDAVLLGFPSGSRSLYTNSRDLTYGATFPVTPGDLYRFSVDCYPDATVPPTGNFTVGLVLLSSPGAVIAYYGSGSESKSVGGWRTHKGMVSIPAGAQLAQIWVQIDTFSASGNWWFRNLIVNKAASSDLIVDGAITASKIAAGAITADMIQAGTLNAANVNVTNLNASNITTGTLSASKVLFADGSALTTASRVVTALANETSTATASGAGAPGTLIPGLAFNVNASSTADVYNLMGSLSGGQTTGTPGTICYVNLYVDGVYKQAAAISYATLNGTQSNSFIMSITGLSAGAHTLQLYLQSSLSGATFQTYVGSSVLCQRIF